ncbi:hypothetical protein HYH03_011298 [Edaphochlamys debaryana]|uniref:Uncharacterized protein n=1 Tax=Edaphochlamys debaryana TaxID=47281 RepID=A0A836BWI0_9CHLO|nr:hypothetical protein HYH03_011298 [Edaphochlamys debaryana]|eukprot:KAG2490168.1 hypothetical protein HYH03_011298 [Edaphochlamys debaryana]
MRSHFAVHRDGDRAVPQSPLKTATTQPGLSKTPGKPGPHFPVASPQLHAREPPHPRPSAPNSAGVRTPHHYVSPTPRELAPCSLSARPRGAVVGVAPPPLGLVRQR